MLSFVLFFWSLYYGLESLGAHRCHLQLSFLASLARQKDNPPWEWGREGGGGGDREGGVATAEVCSRYEGDEKLNFVDLVSVSGLHWSLGSS